MNFVEQIVAAILKWLTGLANTPPDIAEGNAPKDLKDNLHRRIADLPGLPEQGGDREER